MRTIALITAIALLLFPRAGVSEDKHSPEIVSGYLSSLAYSCEQLSIIARLQAESTTNKSFTVDKFNEAKSCVTDARATGKAAFQESVKRYPDYEGLLTHVYSKWLTHLETLVYYSEEAEQKRTEIDLTNAQNDLQAAVDARPPSNNSSKRTR